MDEVKGTPTIPRLYSLSAFVNSLISDDQYKRYGYLISILEQAKWGRQIFSVCLSGDTEEVESPQEIWSI